MSVFLLVWFKNMTYTFFRNNLELYNQPNFTFYINNLFSKVNHLYVFLQPPRCIWSILFVKSIFDTTKIYVHKFITETIKIHLGLMITNYILSHVCHFFNYELGFLPGRNTSMDFISMNLSLFRLKLLKLVWKMCKETSRTFTSLL